MEKEYILWIMGAALMVIYGISAFMVKSHLSTANRLTRLETMWSMISKQAAEILHSPHTPEFDILLEKLVKTYEDRNYELSVDEWQQLQQMSQEVKEDLSEPKGSRLLAAMVYAQCNHKLSCFKITTKC